MKKLLTFAVALIATTLVSCSPQPTNLTLPNCTASLVGTEAIKTQAGNNALRVYFEITNTSEAILSPFSALEINAEQSGKPLDSDFVWDQAVPEDAYYGLGVYPGVTLRFSLIYPLTDTSKVQFKVGAPGEDPLLTTSVSPKHTTPPKTPFTPTPISAPTRVSGLPDSGTIGGQLEVAIKDAKMADGKLTVSYQLTNHSKAEKSFDMVVETYAYQDGIELLPVATDTGDAVAPGKTTTATITYSLRTQSPVEVTLGLASKPQLGKLISLSD